MLSGALDKVSIMGYDKSYEYSGRVFAHVMGHALGMDNDYGSFGCISYNDVFNCTKADRTSSDGTLCSESEGVMSYTEKATLWTKCSSDDFKRFMSESGGFCLPQQCVKGPVDEEITNDDSSNDTIDNGTSNGFTIEHPSSSCSDVRGKNYCSNFKRSGRCNEPNGERFCSKTCKICEGGDVSTDEQPAAGPCKDELGQGYCISQKIFGICSTEYGMESCRKTCQHCSGSKLPTL